MLTEPQKASPEPTERLSVPLLLYRNGKDLIAYVTRMIPPSLATIVDPIDVVQDVYVEAMRRADDFHPVDADHVRRWLRTIARRRVIDLQRHHAALRQGGDGIHAAGAAESEADRTVHLLEEVVRYIRTPSQSAAAHEMVALINQTISNLPSDYASVLRQMYFDGLSGKAVAARLARTEKSVDHLRIRAIEALRLRLRSSLALG